MQIQMVQHGRVLRTISHEGEIYVESPSKGTYKLRVSNNHYKRRLVVISVDGVNIVSGEPASHTGGGYVLDPWQVIEIPGYRRDDGEVAAFQFTEQGGSYSAQTGKGTSNVGVIGMAVFDEYVQVKVPTPPVVIHEHHHHNHGYGNPFGPTWTGIPRGPMLGQTICNSTVPSEGGVTLDSMALDDDDAPMMMAGPAAAGGAACAEDDYTEPAPEPTPMSQRSLQDRLAAYKSGEYNPMSGKGGVDEKTSGGLGLRTRRRIIRSAHVLDVGTGYGHKVMFRTGETTFKRTSETPSFVVVLRYATRQRLKSWGVPIEPMYPKGPTSANPFPAEGPSVAAPPGWRG